MGMEEKELGGQQERQELSEPGIETEIEEPRETPTQDDARAMDSPRSSQKAEVVKFETPSVNPDNDSQTILSEVPK